MSEIVLKTIPTSHTGMLIRRSCAEVFAALVDPFHTTQFWFTHSSGPLTAGAQVEWRWAMYDATAQIQVTVLEPDQRIAFVWPGYSGLTTVEWQFQALEAAATFVSVTESGFSGTGDELVAHIANSTEGFTMVLAGLKAYLEYGLRLNLVADRYPPGLA